jgi:hypothetical protein
MRRATGLVGSLHSACKDAGFLQCSTLLRWRLAVTYPPTGNTVTNTTYNGWANRETWAIGLHLMDTVVDWINDDIDAWSKDDTKDAAVLFQDLVAEQIEGAELSSTFPLLLDLLDLSSVNWKELGQSALDSVFD